MGFPMLVAAIRASGQPQWKIAQMAGMSESRVSRIIRRGSATDAERATLSRLLGVPAEQLFGAGPDVTLSSESLRPAVA
jgi:hypothetical protein